MTNKEIEEWIEEWCNLYPENVENNGVRVKSLAKDCVKRMQKFCKDNPTYSKETIFAATQMYVYEKSQQNYDFMKRSMYFIGKLGEQSLLEAYCLKYSERHNVVVRETNNCAKLDDCYSPIDDFI